LQPGSVDPGARLGLLDFSLGPAVTAPGYNRAVLQPPNFV